MDSKGWFRWESARIRAASWALRRLPRSGWLGRLLEPVEMWLMPYAYLSDGLKRGDMPAHVRIGGVWR